MKIQLTLIIALLAFTSCSKKISDNIAENQIKIAFGSCSDEDKDQFLWTDILSEKPHVWIWLGDNIYGDSEDVEVLEEKYALQKSHADYQKMMKNMSIIGTWDDHDYGINDGGKNFKSKKGSQNALLDFLDVPEEDERRTREGVYTSHDYDINGIKVKVILLDTRYFRDDIEKLSDKHYIPNHSGTILGEDQWEWLEKTMEKSSADVNIIASSIQVLPVDHRFEKWYNFPKERERLMDLIVYSGAKNPIIISGDRHIGEISKADWRESPIFEVTSSSLTHGWKTQRRERNQFRVGPLIYNENYGIIEITRKEKEKIDVLMSIKSKGKNIETDLTRQKLKT